jgi:hypothetical protein
VAIARGIGNSGSFSAASGALTQAVTINDLIIVVVSIRTTTSTVKTDGTGITDNVGNSYTSAKSTVLNNGTSCRVEMWWTVSTGTNAANGITVGLTATSKFALNIQEFTGVQGTGGTASAAVTSNVPQATAPATLDPNNWASIGVAAQGTATFSSGVDTGSGLTVSPDVSRVTSGGSGSTNVGGAEGSEGPIVASGTVYTPKLTLSVSEAWAVATLEMRSVAPLMWGWGSPDLTSVRWVRPQWVPDPGMEMMKVVSVAAVVPPWFEKIQDTKPLSSMRRYVRDWEPETQRQLVFQVPGWRQPEDAFPLLKKVFPIPDAESSHPEAWPVLRFQIPGWRQPEDVVPLRVMPRYVRDWEPETQRQLGFQVPGWRLPEEAFPLRSQVFPVRESRLVSTQPEEGPLLVLRIPGWSLVNDVVPLRVRLWPIRDWEPETQLELVSVAFVPPWFEKMQDVVPMKAPLRRPRDWEPEVPLELVFQIPGWMGWRMPEYPVRPPQRPFPSRDWEPEAQSLLVFLSPAGWRLPEEVSPVQRRVYRVVPDPGPEIFLELISAVPTPTWGWGPEILRQIVGRLYGDIHVTIFPVAPPSPPPPYGWELPAVQVLKPMAMFRVEDVQVAIFPVPPPPAPGTAQGGQPFLSGLGRG